MAKKENTIVYKDEWVRLYNEGLSIREIGRRYGYAMSTVKSRISDSINKREKSENDKYHGVWGDLYNKKFTLTQIADVYGVNKTVVRRVLVKYGYIEKKIKRGVYTHLQNDMLEMYKQGKSLREISEELNISAQTILNYIKSNSDNTIRCYSESLRIYNYKEDYFESLTEEGAFVLGLIVRTSFIINEPHRRVLRMGFSGSKKEVIDFMAQCIDYTEIKPNYNEKEKFYRPEIYGGKFIDDLISIGVRIKGSEYNRLKIEERFKLNFLDGYIYSSYRKLKNCISIAIENVVDEKDIVRYIEALGMTKYEIVNNKVKKTLKITGEDVDKFNSNISEIKLKYKI